LAAKHYNLECLENYTKIAIFQFYHYAVSGPTVYRRSQEFVLGPNNGRAKGAEIETPKTSRGKGYGLYGKGVYPSPAD